MSNITDDAVRRAFGKRIVGLRLDADRNKGNGALVFDLGRGGRLVVFDAGQSCCEHRYLHTDDDLSEHVGATLQNFEIKEGPERMDRGEVVETLFLDVTTSEGTFQVRAHNEHNGYYGGFLFRAELLDEVTA